MTCSKPLTPLVKNYQSKSLFNHCIVLHESFELECGETFENLTISYSTYGQLNDDASNVIWVCHALTADANPKDWWPGLVGENDLYNPDNYYIVCANIIGSAYGTTSPLDCEDSKRFERFPQITIRDNIAAFDQLKNYLGIKKIHTLIGGSMGGQQAMEWAIIDKEICHYLILLATSAVMSPWSVAFNQSQRLAIEADLSWTEPSENAASSGLKAARSIALLSYRNNKAYNSTQKDVFAFDQTLNAVSYQSYQGDKLVERFNAYSYHALTKTMDSHDVGRNRGSISQALSSISAKTLVIGINSDLLFPIEESKLLAELIPNAQLQTIDSDYGHDGFLIETNKISKCINDLYQVKNNQQKKSTIGMFGLGCVGQGVVELLNSTNDTIDSNHIKSIVVKHEYKARESAYDIVGTNANQVINDVNLNTIVEVIDDDVHALRIAQLSKEQGKHFVTANKKMIAENLSTIIDWSNTNLRSILYEAAVAGSIPIIRNLDLYFESKNSQSIDAIVNGTSNYILTQMFRNKCDYSEALQKAQNLGYAESDPRADVAGFDAKYKAVILALHAFGFLIDPKFVLNLGIQNISSKDIKFAQSKNLCIKQIANIEKTGRGITISVMPQFVKKDSELAKTDNVDNLIVLKNNHTEFYFKGAGAGGIATATAILSDINATKNNYKYDYQVNHELKLDNDKLINLYISKNDSINKLKLKGGIVEETNEYIILATELNSLDAKLLEKVFVAKI